MGEFGTLIFYDLNLASALRLVGLQDSFSSPVLHSSSSLIKQVSVLWPVSAPVSPDYFLSFFHRLGVVEWLVFFQASPSSPCQVLVRFKNGLLRKSYKKLS